MRLISQMSFIAFMARRDDIHSSIYQINPLDMVKYPLESHNYGIKRINNSFKTPNSYYNRLHITYATPTDDLDSFDEYFKEENYKNLPPERQLEQLNRDKQMYNSLKRMIRRSKDYEVPQNEIVSEVVYPPPSPPNSNSDDAGDSAGSSNSGADGLQHSAVGDVPEIYDRNYKPVRTQINSNTTLELVTSIIQQPSCPGPAPSDLPTIVTNGDPSSIIGKYGSHNNTTSTTHGTNANTGSTTISTNATSNDNNESSDGSTSLSQSQSQSSDSEDNFSHFNLKRNQYFTIKDYTENEPIHENEIYLKEINRRLASRNLPPISVDSDENSPEDRLGQDTSHDSNTLDFSDDSADRWTKFDRLNSDRRFVRELRELRLEKAHSYRRFLRDMRESDQGRLATHYRGLPVTERGYRAYSKDDIPKFSYEEMQEELRNRGYRCSFDKPTLEKLLLDALEEDDDWRYENIVKQELSPDNTNLPEYARNRLRELDKKVELLNESSDSDEMSVRIKRLEAVIDLIQYHTDPVGYLELDRREESPDALELEQIKKAPTVYDTTFMREMARPITRLPDLIPKTFNLQEDYFPGFPITPMRSNRELEDLKKEYLTIPGGIHQQTLPEISERFQVSIDFLGDACCRLGAHAPIDLTKELRGIVSYSAIWDLLQFLNVCDGAEIELFYTRMDLREVARELGVGLDRVHACLREMEVKAPFGDDTHLNMTCLRWLEHKLSRK